MTKHPYVVATQFGSRFSWVWNFFEGKGRQGKREGGGVGWDVNACISISYVPLSLLYHIGTSTTMGHSLVWLKAELGK
jgi:hypothetical protein